MTRLWRWIFAYYGYAITVVVVLLLFSSIPNYLFQVDISPILPKHYIYGFILLAVPYLLSFRIPKIFIKSPLLLWCLSYVSIMIIWFIPSSMSETIQSIFVQRTAAVIIILLSFFIMLNSPRGLNTGRWVILICVFLAIINNFYEIFHPYSFVPPDHEFSNLGRAAGFYINPNQSGAALVLGLIFSIGLIPAVYRVPYAILTLLGVLSTFSRAAILGLFIVVIVMVKQSTLRVKDCLIGLALITAMGLMATPILLNFVEVEKGVSLVNVHERIGWFTSLGGIYDDVSVDASQEERRDLARLSWDLFADHPVIGNGMGSTTSWSERSSTHNMYLYFMADYGIIGALILPFLVLSVTYLARDEARQIAMPFSVFVLFWGFFSHNILDEYYFLLSFALMAMVTAKKNNITGCEVVADPAPITPIPAGF